MFRGFKNKKNKQKLKKTKPNTIPHKEHKHKPFFSFCSLNKWVINFNFLFASSDAYYCIFSLILRICVTSHKKQKQKKNSKHCLLTPVEVPSIYEVTVSNFCFAVFKSLLNGLPLSPYPANKLISSFVIFKASNISINLLQFIFDVSTSMLS